MSPQPFIYKSVFTRGKAWIPRRCFVCKEKGGWGKKNVDHIYIHSFRCGSYWAHFHPHCLKDIICCPENYKNEDVHFAVQIHKKWAELLLKESIDRKVKKQELKNAQKEICKGDIK